MNTISDEITLSIIPFSDEIVGADDNSVYIQYQDGCILKVAKEEFMTMVTKWIEKKAEYCKRYGHWCGVMGNFYIEDYEEVGKVNIHTVGEDNECIYKDVPIYEVKSFDHLCDMEHG